MEPKHPPPAPAVPPCEEAASSAPSRPSAPLAALPLWLSAWRNAQGFFFSSGGVGRGKMCPTSAENSVRRPYGAQPRPLLVVGAVVYSRVNRQHERAVYAARAAAPRAALIRLRGKMDTLPPKGRGRCVRRALVN
ncbi:unnamed protein product [Pleuronectes platessa]|uniref:Uncharacterized protein n=1 Tax=Pleuronectes platessa TaxID=8262 RepID=A0A9N7YTY1_PLEPL|nr:unnamed protein product [Pleuronectes platessa]